MAPAPLMAEHFCTNQPLNSSRLNLFQLCELTNCCLYHLDVNFLLLNCEDSNRIIIWGESRASSWQREELVHGVQRPPRFLGPLQRQSDRAQTRQT